MKSIVSELCSEKFPRVRVGTGSEEKIYNLVDYVLEKVDDDKYTVLKKGIEKAAIAIEEILKNGIDMSMNKFN